MDPTHDEPLPAVLTADEAARHLKLHDVRAFNRLRRQHRMSRGIKSGRVSLYSREFVEELRLRMFGLPTGRKRSA